MNDSLIDDVKTEENNFNIQEKTTPRMDSKYLDLFMEQCLEYENCLDVKDRLIWPFTLICGIAVIHAFVHDFVDYVISRHFCTQKVTSVIVAQKDKIGFQAFVFLHNDINYSCRLLWLTMIS